MKDLDGREWSLRVATEDDLSAVAAIERFSNPAPWSEKQFAAELEKPYSTFWVMTDDETDEEIAAFAIFHRTMDPWQLLSIAVVPKYRRQGFARELLRQLFKEAGRLGVSKITLEVRRVNESAVSLYQSIGFNICQIHRHYYSNGDDAFVMQKEVAGDPLGFSQD